MNIERKSFGFKVEVKGRSYSQLAKQSLLKLSSADFNFEINTAVYSPVHYETKPSSTITFRSFPSSYEKALEEVASACSIMETLEIKVLDYSIVELLTPTEDFIDIFNFLKENTDKPLCVNCGLSRVVANNEIEVFSYGPSPSIELKAEVVVYECGQCGFRHTDSLGEVARDEAVKAYLASHRVVRPEDENQETWGAFKPHP